MPISSLKEAIESQIEINQFLSKNGIRDLVGDYGEFLVLEALGGEKQTAVTQGFDIKNKKFGKIEVKTRKYELKQDGSIKKENRAVGFKGKEEQFDWLAHIVLDVNFKVVKACLAVYAEVWPEVQRTKDKIGFATSSKLESSIDITLKIQDAQMSLNKGI
ncbi:hypothetical protein [Vibrio algicola]|uniref:Uncharacterized protein n=1 Tax=Vibrio algicola TaxID=2662262 RepID=A0A5Q0TL61_9VIBR|nr:hypothetical protein [Vibrio algicola]